jgi:hypothetical protein
LMQDSGMLAVIPGVLISKMAYFKLSDLAVSRLDRKL